MLTKLDETLAHQGPTTFDHALTSDHRFFDRTVYGVHHDGELQLVMGLAAYKNMNVQEGFACVHQGDKQYNLRLSRALRPHIGEMHCGPLSIDIIEPWKKMRLVLEPGDYSHSFDLLCEAALPPTEEDHHFARFNGRPVQDYARFDQLLRVSGEFVLNGERTEVRDWFGFRDHSWGVRPGVGGFEPQNGQRPRGDGSLFIWLAFTTDDMGGQFQMAEDADGNLLSLDGHIGWPEDSGQPDLRVASVEHDISFIPGNRVFDAARLLVTTEDGQEFDIRAEAVGRPWAYKGTGYDSGYDDELGLGAWRGEELLVEHDIYDVSEPEEVGLPDGRRIRPVHREQPVCLTVNGHPGYGHLPVINWGRVSRYGLG